MTDFYDINRFKATDPKLNKLNQQDGKSSGGKQEESAAEQEAPETPASHTSLPPDAVLKGLGDLSKDTMVSLQTASRINQSQAKFDKLYGLALATIKADFPSLPEKAREHLAAQTILKHFG